MAKSVIDEGLLEINLFLDYLLDERKYSKLTAEAYKQDIKDFLKFMRANDLHYNDANTMLIRTYMLDLTVRGYKKTSIRRTLSGLSQFYTFLVIKGLINRNPFELVNKPKVTRELPDFLEGSDIRELFNLNKERDDVYATRDQAIIELLFASGLRVSELTNLTLQTVNVKGRTVRVFGKGKKERIVPFTVDCQKAIDIYLLQCRPVLITRNKKTYDLPNELFLNHQGSKLTARGVEYILQQVEKKIGAYYKLHPHKLRHTFATTLLNKGADLRTIQELMGHTSIGTTQIYTHVTYSNMKETYDRVFPRAKRKPSDND